MKRGKEGKKGKRGRKKKRIRGGKKIKVKGTEIKEKDGLKRK